MQDYCLEELLAFLKDDLNDFSVVVMPDFFLDRLVSVKKTWRSLSEDVGKVAERKGGSIDSIEQAELRGGNAINTASALTTLGVHVIPIACTDNLGVRLIKFFLKTSKADLSHIKTVDKASMTTAFEFNSQGKKVNVMLRDIGSLMDFGPSSFDESDFTAIENADYVCVFNWAGTRRFGTELARTVFRHAKTRGNGKTYYDTADPTPNKAHIPELMRNVLQDTHIDVFSVNENEAICYASHLSEETAKLAKTLQFEELAKESAKALASHLSARVDLHTTGFSATFTKKRETIVPSFKVQALRVTGAGDAWNAGNILGDAHGISDECRLALANAVAAYYISNPEAKHPTRKQLAEFIKQKRRRNR